jgi:hypothetical protein
MLSKKKSIGLVVAAAVLAGVAGGGVAWHEHQQHTTKPTTQHNQSQSIAYQGVTGKTALELLQQQHHVVTKTYKDFGDMVVSIDGRAADNNHFWSFYLNGHQAQVGAGAYQTKASDHISWKLEAIQ